MPPYLYALIGAFVFAIAHGMHFTVAPLPGASTHVATLDAPTLVFRGAMPAIPPTPENKKIMSQVHDDVSVAASGY